MSTAIQKQNIFIRLWIYQYERFPIVKHGTLIAAFSFCATCLSALLRGDPSWPNIQTMVTAFICLFLFFLQLRIADEFKDHENDKKFRPERPVPRGLVSLDELKCLGLVSSCLQVILSYFLSLRLLIILPIVWAYMAMMSMEFFVPKWLKNKPFTYLWTHMLIIPLIDLFATGCDWLQFSTVPPKGLAWFLLVSFFNGIVIEIGRKTWAPEQESEGIESYSSDWGIQSAIGIWAASIVLSHMCACFLATKIMFFTPIFVSLSIIAFLLVIFGFVFIHNPTPNRSKLLEEASGLWVVGLYLVLGIIPMGYSVWIS